MGAKAADAKTPEEGNAEVAPQSAPAPLEIGNLTPMMRQYLETKAAHPEAILFFRLGDFYEMFFEDAVKASEILQITLTSRAKGADRVPMCGVPYHSARRYVAKLIEHGLKVAICEQAEEAGGPGIVRREVVRVITPGMVLDEEVLQAHEPNFLAAIAPGQGAWGAALLDASTGEFVALPAQSLEGLIDELSRAAPRELLVPEDAKGSAELTRLASALSRRPALATLEPGAFDASRAGALLRSHFQVASLEGFGLSENVAANLPAIAAAGAALRYLKDTQRSSAPHVDRLTVSRRGRHLVLDESSLANLEVLRTLKDGGRKGSLLSVLDRTATSPGARKLARWLTAPLCELPVIEARLDTVEELSVKGVFREELFGALREIADLERLSGRLAMGVGNARDLKALGGSLARFPAVCSALRRCESALLRALTGPLEAEPLPTLAAELDRAISDEPPITLKEGGLFKTGYDRELDELVALATSGREFLLAIETRERERTKISSLKVRFNKVFGYYIEVTRANLHLVPDDYQRKQTTVGSERFVTPELKEYEEKVLTAEERRGALEFQLFEALRSKVVSAAGALRAASEAVATVDALLSFARCAAENGYVRPLVDDSGVLEISAGRHPVVERMLGSEPFVPNDLRLDAESRQLLIITGPNMAGKSTVMRQAALITLMAQAGSFVPAQKARVGLCDRIFTRVGASDNLARGQSTFMVEMTEAANILHNATSKSLVILDEIGRGTSTFDGLSIAWAVAEHLHDRVGARTLFATHYHELVDLSREKPRVKNCSVAVKEFQGKVLFLRKLVEGGASRSYGIEVAKLAGLPKQVLDRAREILANLESGELDEAGRPRLTKKLARQSSDQLGLFVAEPKAQLQTTEAKVLDELRALGLDATSPLEALNTLARWKKALE